MNRQKTEKVAHRGLTGLYDRGMGNTLTAFRDALNSGVDAVELDIKMTKDGHLVVFHDPYLNLKTNGRGAVKRHTLAELRRLRIKGTNERIPTAEEVFQLFEGSQTRLILDFLNPQILGKLHPLIEKYHLQDQIEYTSINHRMLKKLKDQQPSAKTAPAFFGLRSSHIIERADHLQTSTVHLYFLALLINPHLLPRLQKAGLHVRAFTVNHLLLAYLLMQRGVSIISNRPNDIQPPETALKQRFLARLLEKRFSEKYEPIISHTKKNNVKKTSLSRLVCLGEVSRL